MGLRSTIGSAIVKYNDLIKVIHNPHGGQKIAVVPAAKPDVAIVHWDFHQMRRILKRAAKRTIVRLR